MNRRNWSITKRNVAIFLAATFIPVIILTAVGVGAVMKLINPDNVDVTQDLAYLGYSIISALVVGAIWVVLTALLCWVLYRQDKSFVAIRLPLTILVINLILGAGIMLFREIDGAAQDTWSRANNQPTRQERDAQLDKYFDAIKKQ